MSKKIALKLDLHDDKEKQKVLKAVSALQGIDSVGLDMKEQKLTVVGPVDPIDVVKRLRRRSWKASIVSVGPAEEKKAEPKKEEGKKEPEKKKEEPKKEEKKADPREQLIAELANAYRSCNARMNNHYYYVQWVEEDPNPCAIL